MSKPKTPNSDFSDGPQKESEGSGGSFPGTPGGGTKGIVPIGKLADDDEDTEEPGKKSDAIK
jgi:hypothetical protein